MTTIYQPDTISSLAHAKQLMADSIRDALPAASRTSERSAVVRLEVRVDTVEPMSWLAAQKYKTRIYWSNREGSFEMAGVGIADQVTVSGDIDYRALFDRMHRFLSADVEGLRFYGGIRFNGRSAAGDHVHDSLWGKFGGCRFVIPRFEIVRQSDETFFACNFIADDTDVTSILAELEELAVTAAPVTVTPPRLVSRLDDPDRKKWQGMVESVLESIAGGDLEKLVLARRISLEFAESLNPLYLVGRLRDATAECYHFCFQFDGVSGGAGAFVGASPERLYYRWGRHIKSEAVAGTRPRGTDAAEDERLGAELMRSEKERHEHRLVITGIQQALQPLCRTVDCDEHATLLKLTRLQHLLARFEGTLSDTATDADILGALHPTPAVGGYPVGAAVERLNGGSSLEPFDRGWYAGPVGWVARDEVEFAVGIRSGLVADNRLHLYAGAGIVGGSTPEGEWNEIENKVNNFIIALVTP
jgi:menaquinone-specific isochorismate synthase